MRDTGLVLEGGGLRGVYTAGILEYFLKQDIQFPNVIGVSAGACNAASYISKQEKRNYAITVGYAGNPDYLSVRRLFRHGELFNMDLIFDRIPNKEYPFDYETFFKNEQQLYTGVTDCLTGETIYYNKNEVRHDLNKILRASSSLPMIAPVVYHNDRPLLDGGISDPIPVNYSISLGNRKHVVVLTQEKGYQKQPAKRGMWYFEKKYKHFPGLVDVVKRRFTIYNNLLKKVEQLEEDGQAFVFRPENLQGVGRIEKNAGKLDELYQHGYEHAKSRQKEMELFLKS
ncbi:patatin-like phospholipase family protein [Salisediminibacterium selenitireducens]|uniref:Patatin n=1 Tax=Bacillus selenitireducens (strain ATCC 700615 / DSM 15326 / MLS10) TaxID=439292 RepID=D6XUT1_BACIE|nr:patatin family protein [Salisediminibacterium selenitireducens]ADH99567.1 Patatin [[Bacillus] selenitireducens MLS10]